MVPFLNISLMLPLPLAIGTSACVIPFAAASSMYSYAKQKSIAWRFALTLSSFALPFTCLGAYLSKVVPQKHIALILATVLFFISFRIICSTLKNKGEETAECKPRLRWFAPPVSALAGFVAGLLGIGGGAIYVPIMLPCGFTIHSAVATCSFLLFATGLTSAISHILIGNLSLTDFLLLMPTAIIGAQLGAWKLKQIRSSFLRILFASALLLVAVRMIFR